MQYQENETRHFEFIPGINELKSSCIVIATSTVTKIMFTCATVLRSRLWLA